jgi:hypothetical protein
MNLEDLNQCIHPINALEVAKGFDNKWRDFGGDSSDNLLDLWRTVCETFNKIYLYNHNKIDKTYLSIPAPTGSGKTQLLKYYAAELVKQRSDIGMLIVTKFTAEAEEAAQDINEWSNNFNAAAAYYTDSSISRDELHRFNDIQVAVITHENYIRNHSPDATNHCAYQQVATYKGSYRELIVIDEEVNLINNIGISKPLVSDIESALTALFSRTQDVELEKEWQLTSYLFNNYETLFYKDNKHKRLVGSKQALIRKIAHKLNVSEAKVKELFYLESLKNNARGGLLGDVTTTAVNTIVRRYAQNIKYLLDDNLYEYNGKSGYEYRTSTLEYPNKSVAILDATANSNSVGVPDTQMVRLPSIKTYEQVRLFKVKTNEKSLGKGLFDKLNKPGCEEDGIDYMPSVLCDFAQFNYKEEDGNDKTTAFFTHLKVEEKLIGRLGEVSIDHFGNLTGVNKYKNCNNIIIYGIQRKPSYIYIDALMHQIGVNALLDENKDKLIEIEYSEISADILQAINRGKCRGIINGKAPRMDVQLTVPNNKKLTNQLLDFITKSMPGIQVLDSPYVLDLTMQPKPVGDDAKFINAVDECESDTILKDIKDSLGLSKKKWERMLNHLTKPECSNSFLAISIRAKDYKIVKKGKSYWITIK